MTPLAGLCLVLLALGVLMGVARLLRSRFGMQGESSRKLVHIGMGVICLSFPWVFDTIWPVWLLALLACFALLAVRNLSLLRSTFGGVLHGVDRESWGELYFPIGVATVFTLARGEPVTFIVPVAALTFADAAGALVGKRFGRRRFATLEGTKTLEGSLAVGAVGFFCAFIPLLAYGAAWTTCVLIGVLVGLFCLLVEAISWRGLDNIFLPLAVYAQMAIYTGLDDAALLQRAAALIVITTAAAFWRRGDLVDGSARLGAALALYFFWGIGGLAWLVPPLVLLVSYVRFMPPPPPGVPRHNLHAIICICAGGLVWCVAHGFAPRAHWLLPFTVAMGTQQAIIATVRFSQARPGWSRSFWWAAGCTLALVTQGTGYVLMQEISPSFRWQSGIAAAALLAGTAVFALWERRIDRADKLSARWWKQGTCAVGASLLTAFSSL
jgi:phytol kinase